MKVRLMAAAMDLMWQNNYGAASVEAICERAGAKKGSFYYFFKSKSELAAAALEADWNKKKAEMDSIFSPIVPPLERFDRYFDFVYDRLVQLQQKCGSILGCPFVSVGSEVIRKMKLCAKRSIESWIASLSISSQPFAMRLRRA